MAKPKAINSLRLVAFALPLFRKETMTIDKKLEELKRKKVAAEKKLIAARHKEKQLEHELKRLTRSERTHRLCTRGAMLESFLISPEVLTDDDVMDILKQAFSQTGMKEAVAESVKGRVAGKPLTE